MLNFLKSKAGNIKGLQEHPKAKSKKKCHFHIYAYTSMISRRYKCPGALILMEYTPKPRLWGVGKRKADRLRVIAYYIWKDIPV